MVPPVIGRLVDAINNHDVEALVACFAPDFANTWPAHPTRSFTGAEQVRRNWELMFQARPDIKATVTGQVGADNVSWAEWEFAGTERDGTRFHQRGVIIMVVQHDVIVQARFYMEPVEAAPPAQ